MPTLISGIQIALHSLLAQSQAVEITEHNVANSSTPGYRRQAPGMTAAIPNQPYGVDRGPLAGVAGNGVLMNSIRRMSTDFTDTRYRAAAAAWEQASAESKALADMEVILNAASTTGLPARMDAFWNSWQALAANPSDLPTRGQVLSNAQNLATALNDRAEALMGFRATLDQQMVANVAVINDAAGQVAALNAQIARYQSAGEQPNDFLDERGRLLDQLAQSAGAVSYLQPDGQVSVSIGGHVLVAASTSQALQVQRDPANASLSAIRWEDGAAFQAPHGEIAGLLRARDTAVPQQLAALDQLAGGLASQVNNLHQTGFGLNGATGQDFFTGSSALTLALNPALNTTNLAAATAAGQPANGALADQIARLREAKTMNGGLESLQELCVNQAASLGQEVQSAGKYAGGQQLLAEALDEQRESQGGVSLDEEAANLLRYQKAYQAAARLMTAFDEMLDTVINRMGMVGR